MTVAYIVRCNFKDSAREADWNAWYSGPKLKQMLEKPGFLTGQRFRRTSGEGRDYVAFWTLASADAFTTPEYTNDWGFFEWKPYIGDWSRDLFEAVTGDVAPPQLREGQALRMISFEGLDAAGAEASKRAIEALSPNVAWLRSVGLDRHTPMLGFRVDGVASEAAALPETLRATEVVYEPISDFARTLSATPSAPLHAGSAAR